LQNLLTAGAARNAVDCALWDLRAKQTGKSVAETLGITVPRRSETAFTLSLDTPERMADEAARVPGCRLFKLKVGQGCSDLERVQAVHRVSPDAQLILDANEGWQPEQYRAIAPLLESYPVVALEQPVAVRNQDCLREIKTPIPVYADESCHDGQSLAGLRGLYQGVNVKLDKTGGLTEALDVMRRSKDLGFRIMLGCMVSTSLGLTPALHLAGYADILDLDGAITLVRDRDHPLQYHESTIDAGTAAVWGMPEKY
jgi:L-alanine-DL-glutamate epimerase-like enolase superfamily enzyme